MRLVAAVILGMPPWIGLHLGTEVQVDPGHERCADYWDVLPRRHATTAVMADCSTAALRELVVVHKPKLEGGRQAIRALLPARAAGWSAHPDRRKD